MKKFKKLIPAFCMLLVSAVMLGTTTFAWFSINSEVKATGMNVTAKSETEYFIIADTAAGLTGTTNTTASAKLTQAGIDGGTSTNVYPVAYTETAISGSTIVANKWYTANSNSYTESTPSDGVINYKSVEFGAANYFLKYTFYVGVAQNSSSYDGQLAFALDTGSAEAPIKAAVKINGKKKSDSSVTDADEVTYNALTTSASTPATKYYLDQSNYLTVDVYVYIDGTHTNVKSDTASITGEIKIKVSAYVSGS